MKEEFIKKMREPQNFFKHADKDPEGELKFNPNINNIHLFYAVLTYNQFTDNLPFWIKAYKVWYMGKNPNHFHKLEEPQLSHLKKVSEQDFMRDKKLFIELMREFDSGYIT